MYLSQTTRLELMNTGADILFDEPMKKHTSFKTGGNADVFISVRNTDEIKNVLRICKEGDVPFRVIGNGTNLLVSDSGLRGAVIYVGRGMAQVRCEGEKIYAEAGASLGRVSAVALANSLTGFERLGGIPGSVGGAVCMNAGAYESQICDVLCETSYVTYGGHTGVLDANEYNGGYRRSAYTDSDKIVTDAVFCLKRGNAAEIRAEVDEYTRRRNEKQPLSYPSAGSTFKRPEGAFAGALIERSGLKGYSIGSAQVSEKHAGFVINTGNATSNDIYRLIEHIKAVVYANSGIMLECEVKLMGEF